MRFVFQRIENNVEKRENAVNLSVVKVEIMF